MLFRSRHKKEWEEAIPYLEKSVRQYMKEDTVLQNELKKKEKTMAEIKVEVLKRMKKKNITPFVRKKKHIIN